MAGLYIHIPFCKQACHYCDFHFSTRLEHRTDLVRAICKELVLRKEYLADEEVQTIYFGGGTPSLLTTEEIDAVFSAIQSNYRVREDAEITLEANPDDLTIEKLVSLRASGINRLSIGIQSFDDAVLRFLNRAHSSKSAVQCMSDARAAGFKNISIDLIYAISGQSSETWKSNIASALALSPEHISAYSLTIEEKTVFGKWQRTGKLVPVEEETSADQFEELMDVLADHGYEHYEISNFCQPGMYSRHNSAYWKQEKYLGVGPSAHSYDHTSRQANISNNAQYVKSIEEGGGAFEREFLKPEDKINEYILTTLRTSWGCDLTKLKNELNWDLLGQNTSYITSLEKEQLAFIEKNILKLTRKGKLLADKIASDLFADTVLDS